MLGAVGTAAYLAPVVLIPIGALMVAKSALVDVRPFRLGLGVALAGLMLTLGTAHGGLVGDGLESLVALGLGTTGATILGVLLDDRRHAVPDRREPGRDPPPLGACGAQRAHARQAVSGRRAQRMSLVRSPIPSRVLCLPST